MNGVPGVSYLTDMRNKESTIIIIMYNTLILTVRGAMLNIFALVLILKSSYAPVLISSKYFNISIF